MAPSARSRGQLRSKAGQRSVALSLAGPTSPASDRAHLAQVPIATSPDDVPAALAMPANQDEDADEDRATQAPPTSPNGLFNFGPGSVVVTDADEEIMELYMALASTSDASRATSSASTATTSSDRGSGGLGFLDASKSVIEMELVINPTPTSDVSTKLHAEVLGGAKQSARGKARTREKGEGKAARAGDREMVLPVVVQQDLQLLKGSKGDTGSVLWRSSLHLARHILTQHHFPPPSLPPLLAPTSLASARILELGAGTGVLAALLAPLCASYVASDRYENLRLLSRNLELNGRAPALAERAMTSSKGSPKARKAHLQGGSSSLNGKHGAAGGGPSSSRGAGGVVLVEEIDWVAVDADAKRKRATSTRSTNEREEGYSLVLAVDCIFNEGLVVPLVSTLGRYCPPGSAGRSAAWVVVELRSSDVLTAFLDAWMNDPSGGWTIVRLGEDEMGRWDGARGRWVGWVGWRTE